MISSINRIKDCIPIRDVRKNNGVVGLQFLRSNAPKMRLTLPPLHLGGNSPVSLYSLYHATHASTACERFAKMCFEICSSIQSIRDCSTVTFMRGLFSIESHSILSHVLNTFEIDVFSISQNEIGALQNDKINSLSASSADPGRRRFHPHGMSDELLGPRPRGSMGFSPALPHTGPDPEAAGGDGHLRPPALDGPRRSPHEEVTI